MLFFTGDFHGEYARYDYIPMLTDGDYLVICGDYGFLFYPPADTVAYVEQQHQLNELENLPYMTLFVDGNHENFDLIESYPVEMWNGGKIHRIRSNILHLMRGQVYDIDGVKLFSMGGAYSIDKYMRRERYSWWPQEQPNNEEYKEATKNLEAVGYKVDVVVTHTAPQSIIYRMGKAPDVHDTQLTGYLDWLLRDKLDFKQWYFGHFHIDAEMDDKVRALYYDVVPYNKKD